jgi:putative transcriptional regulator
MTGIRKRYAFSAFLAAILMVFIGHALWAQTRSFTSMTGTEFRPAFQQGTEASLGAGKFLVADRSIRDSLFAEAVILLVDYGPQGAMGLVINHPTEVKLPDVLPNLKGAKKHHDTIQIGGPVGIDQIFMLIRSDSNPQESLHVFGNVYVSTSETVLERMIARPGKGEKFRLYAGYSGWEGGQLEKEVSRGDWHVVDADVQSIFDKKPSAVWQDLIERASGQWVKAKDRQPAALLFVRTVTLLPHGTPNPTVED